MLFLEVTNKMKNNIYGYEIYTNCIVTGCNNNVHNEESTLCKECTERTRQIMMGDDQ